MTIVTIQGGEDGRPRAAGFGPKTGRLPLGAVDTRPVYGRIVTAVRVDGVDLPSPGELVAMTVDVRLSGLDAHEQGGVPALPVWRARFASILGCAA
jgi:hypothetical protein